MRLQGPVVRVLQKLPRPCSVQLFCCVVAMVVVLVLLYNVITSPESLRANPTFTAVSYLGQQRRVRNPNKKVILYWTPFMGVEQAEKEEKCLKEFPCPVKCKLTSSKDNLMSADAVHFHLSDLWPDNWSIGTRRLVDMPKSRSPRQVWVLYNLEPPPNIFADLSVLDGLFNWTIWYRSDATLPHGYGKATPLTEAERIKAKALYAGKDFYSEKTKGVMGAISNCEDQGRRYLLINEMQKHMQIDLFGKCYNRQCSSDHEHLYKCKILHQYKFFLAFENSHCKDYVTEKYWFVLRQGLVPIVNWKHVDSNMAIPDSYINVYDFPSVQEASNYIIRVMNDKELYNRYFVWRQYFKFEEVCTSCTLCRALNDNSRPAQVISDMAGWVKNDFCPTASWPSKLKNKANALLYRFLGVGKLQ